MMIVSIYFWGLITALSCMMAKNLMEMWILMEMNILVTSVILNMENSSFSMEYFSIQSSCSLLIIFTIMLMEAVSTKSFEVMIFILLMFKMSMFPFMSWASVLSSMISWKFTLMYCTIQKVPPLCMIYMMESNFNMFLVMVSNMIMVMLLTSMISSKKILIFTSIVNFSWIMINPKNLLISMTYLMTYTIILKMIISEMKKWNTSSTLKEKNKTPTMMLMFTMIGVPPMSMFWMKWMILKNSFQFQSAMNIMFFILSTSVLSMVYMKFTFTQLNKAKNMVSSSSMKSIMMTNALIMSMMMT